MFFLLGGKFWVLVNLYQCLCSVRIARKAVQICTAVLRRLPYYASIQHIDLHTSVITLYVSDYPDSCWCICSANRIALPLWQHSASLTMQGVTMLSCHVPMHKTLKRKPYVSTLPSIHCWNLTAANTSASACMQQQLWLACAMANCSYRHLNISIKCTLLNVCALKTPSILINQRLSSKHYMSTLQQEPRPPVYHAASKQQHQSNALLAYKTTWKQTKAR